jgi:NADP-dependent 3-hydroxy acid dehydrogenase YdfG
MGVFEGKVVWVTGAGTGIGEAAVRMFAREGAKVALMGRRKEMVDKVAAEIAGEGGEAVAEALDVSQRARVNEVAGRLLDRFGRVDILINNAGLNVVNRRLPELTPEDWDQVIDVNLTGAFNLVEAVLAPMKAQNDGLIVNIASTAAKRVSGVAGIAYVSSKFGMLGMSLSLTQEAWQFGVRTCCILPDDVNTPIMARRKVKYSEDLLAQMIQPEDLADIIRCVALLHPRTSIPELIVTPTSVRPYTPAESGTPG